MHENMIENLKAAIQIIGSLPVTHEAQDVVVAAKMRIRAVLEELKQADDTEK